MHRLELLQLGAALGLGALALGLGALALGRSLRVERAQHRVILRHRLGEHLRLGSRGRLGASVRRRLRHRARRRLRRLGLGCLDRLHDGCRDRLCRRTGRRHLGGPRHLPRHLGLLRLARSRHLALRRRAGSPRRLQLDGNRLQLRLRRSQGRLHRGRRLRLLLTQRRHLCVRLLLPSLTLALVAPRLLTLPLGRLHRPFALGTPSLHLPLQPLHLPPRALCIAVLLGARCLVLAPLLRERAAQLALDALGGLAHRAQAEPRLLCSPLCGGQRVARRAERRLEPRAVVVSRPPLARDFEGLPLAPLTRGCEGCRVLPLRRRRLDRRTLGRLGRGLGRYALHLERARLRLLGGAPLGAHRLERRRVLGLERLDGARVLRLERLERLRPLGARRLARRL